MPFCMDAHAQAISGAAVGALVAANAPALTELDLSIVLCSLALGALVTALPRNTHLRTLDLSGNRLREPFVTEQLLPAVRANTSLRRLKMDDDDSAPPAAQEAMQLVEMRGD